MTSRWMNPFRPLTLENEDILFLRFPYRRYMPDDQSEVSGYSHQTHKLQRFFRYQGRIIDAATTADGTVRAILAHPKAEDNEFDERFSLLTRSSASADWQTVWDSHVDQGDAMFAGFDPGEDKLYLLESFTGNTLGLSILSTTEGRLTPVFRSENFDIDDFYLDGKKSPYAVRVMGSRDFYYPDSNQLAAKIHQSAQRLLQDEKVEIVDWARNNSRAIVLAFNDNDPGSFYLLDTAAMKLSKLFDRSPDPSQTKTRSVRRRINLTDGQGFGGTLTIPFQTPVGLLVMLRDWQFPWADTWNYQPEVQFFVSLGIAVLEVDHRGTIGFGRNFKTAGNGEWGTGVSDDIVAVLDEALKQTGIDRVCILGRRDDAYSALMTIIRHANRFTCGVAISGVYDPSMSLNRRLLSPDEKNRFLRQTFGRDSTPEGRKHLTPAWRARDFRVPLLVVEGTQFSTRLNPGVQDFVRELRRAKADFQLHVEEAKGTYRWLLPQHKQNAYMKIADFVLGTPLRQSPGKPSR